MKGIGPSSEKNGLAAAKKALEDPGFQGRSTVNLASTGKTPADAKVLVLAGPTTEPFPQEMQFLNDFLERSTYR